MCCRYEGLGQQIGRWTLLPKQQAPPTTSLLHSHWFCHQSVGLPDNLNHSVVISLIIDLFFIPNLFLFSVAVGKVPLQLAAGPLPDR